MLILYVVFLKLARMRVSSPPPPFLTFFPVEKVLDAYSKGSRKSNADTAAEEAAQRLWR